MTKEELLETIRQENEWREIEFTNMKLIYSNLSNSEISQNTFLRMCIPYIYAHWEGFAMSSLKLLIKYLNDLKLSYQNVKINLFVLSLNDKFQALAGKQSFEQRCEFSSRFIANLAQELKFDKKNISSKSNLNREVFLELCQIFGFENTNFDNYLTDLQQLVNIRNSIAHGENSSLLNLDNLEKYSELVKNLIFLLTEEIKNYLEEKKYLT